MVAGCVFCVAVDAPLPGKDAHVVRRDRLGEGLRPSWTSDFVLAQCTAAQYSHLFSNQHSDTASEPHQSAGSSTRLCGGKRVLDVRAEGALGALSGGLR